MEVTTHKYTTVYDDKIKEITLQRDGKPIFCHKIPPMIAQSNFGSTMMRMSSGLTCGRAGIYKEGDKLIYRQNCETTACGFELEVDQPKAETKPSSILTT